MTGLSTVALLLALVAQTHAMYFNNYRPRQPVRCSSRSKPCRMSMSLENDWGEPTQTSAAHLCSCNHRATCPTDWTQSDQVVSKSLISATYRTTLSLMFCDAVQPNRVCEGGETSVVMSSFLEIPTDLETYNCMCRDGVPLQLYRRWRDVRDYKYRHEYICDDQQPTCLPLIQPCMTIVGQESRYNCKCSGRNQCGLPNSNTHPHGYCQPPTPPNAVRPWQ